jgi:hypothetical protein
MAAAMTSQMSGLAYSTAQKNRSQEADQQADKISRSKERPTQIREDQIKEDQRAKAEGPGPLRDAMSEGHSTL